MIYDSGHRPATSAPNSCWRPFRRAAGGGPAFALTAVALVFGLAACRPAVVTPQPITAAISRVDNQVFTTAAGQTKQEPASVGLQLSSGTSITTGEQSGVVIELLTGNGVYVEANTAVTLLRIASGSSGTEVDLGLSAGRLLALMPAGQLRIITDLGRVDVVGGAAMVQYQRGPTGLGDGTLTISCLAIACTVNSRVYGGDLSRNEQVAISGSGLSVDHTQLSDAQLASLLGELSAGAEAAVTLTAWPASAASAPSSTPTFTQTTTPVILPTRTLAPTISSPTATASPTDTGTPTSDASATATVPPSPTTRPTRTQTVPPPTRTPRVSPTRSASAS